MSSLNTLLEDNVPVVCKHCGGKMVYTHAGIYECESCHQEEMDSFGKIKKYIEEHGPTSAIILESETGVSKEAILRYLKIGRVEIPQDSNIFIKCESCGCDIRYGRFCPECASRASNNQTKAYFNESVGERPKAQMHFLDKN